MNTELKTNTLPDCFWQQAGVVKKKSCYKDFLCSTCQFDRAMNHVCRYNEEQRAKGLPPRKKGSHLIFWKERLKKLPLAQRLCIHHMKGHIKYKNCPKAYHCVDCEFDQFFYDQFKVNAVLKPVDFDDIHGISLPSGFYLHPGHTWIKIEGNGMVRIGIDDFAARLFGKFDKVDTPVMGKKLSQGIPGFTLMRDGQEVSFVSPVNGIITEVNTRTKKSPGLINKEPYTDGWVFMAYCPELKKDLKNLMFMDTTKEYMEDKVTRLYDFIEEKTQLKAADGGNLVSDIYGNLGVPDKSLWDELVDEFIDLK